MLIQISKNIISSHGKSFYHVLFRVADLPSSETKLIGDYGLSSFVIYATNSKRYALDDLINKGIESMDENIEFVLMFEHAVREGLEKLEQTAAERADFFNGEKQELSITVGKSQGSGQIV